MSRHQHTRWAQFAVGFTYTHTNPNPNPIPTLFICCICFFIQCILSWLVTELCLSSGLLRDHNINPYPWVVLDLISDDSLEEDKINWTVFSMKGGIEMRDALVYINRKRKYRTENKSKTSFNATAKGVIYVEESWTASEWGKWRLKSSLACWRSASRYLQTKIVNDGAYSE